MDTKNNGSFASFSAENAIISLEVHYASEGSLRIRIDENGADYRMQVSKTPPPYELGKYNGEMPKIELLEYNLKLKKELIDKLINGMSGIKIPAVPEFTAGISGSTYILHINNGFNSSRYTWWNKPPKGYESLGRFVELLVEMSLKNGRFKVK
jgi:hypothetical protein